jgi:hypothetical protein
MPKNTAAEELQSLLSMQGEAQDTAANLAKLEEARTQFIARGIDVDDFALPQAVATAVGVGWLLGPVGGLLMGVAQGILAKKERQNYLDNYAADMGVLSETNDIFNNELDRLAMSVTNPNDLEQISALQTQKDAALRMMSSASPELQQQGSQMLSDFSTRMNDYALTQETQRIESEAFEAQLARELDNTQVSRYKESVGNFRAESAGYEGVMQATDIALDALANGTPSDLWAAGILINKSLDPTGVVRQEEAEAVGAIGSIWEKANVLMEKARSGQTMLPEQRKELSNMLYRMRESSTEFQLAREARYADEIDDIGLPAKYRDNFRLATTVPASVQGDMKNVATLPAADIEKAASDAIFPFTDAGIANNLKYAWGNIKDFAKRKLSEDSTEPEKRKAFAEAARNLPK